jgi:hypothetical protein
MQEKLWEKNFICSQKVDDKSNKYAEIEGTPSVTVWAGCPSGDVLVSVTTDGDPSPDYSWWIPYGDDKKTTNLFDIIVPKAHAIDSPWLKDLVAATIKKVLCQKKISNGFIVRRIMLSNNKCYDETLNPRTGKIVSRAPAPCNCSNF